MCIRDRRERACAALKYVGCYELRDENVSNLPYGKQKMLELARAMMASPKLLLLDEPAAGLNPTERMELVSMLEKIFDDGVKLFLVEHNMDVVMNLCHQITVLYDASYFVTVILKLHIILSFF